ncbi:MAG TPA: roadblock/LC7 domain-containing protein [Mycobacteriales bacterium]|jgi:predicted regulator of Ras-like GTPase activity (Roadblock/LC7/MglB family)|nr:roadblock/LC7 domain-containing protein [Mycobacteriales bacterium]
MSAVSDLNWLVGQFSRAVPGITSAAVVSADGLLLAMNEGMERSQGDQLAAIASGMASLTRGAALCFEQGEVRQVMIEMELGFLFVMAISDGSILVTVTDTRADVGLVGYEMARLVGRVGALLTPELRRELQAALPL